MNKFENVDLFAALDAIMRQNTGFYQSDFEIDKKILQEAADSPAAGDKVFLWLSRSAGTHCFKERDVFLKDTAAHNTWIFHGEQTHSRVLAYTVEITDNEKGKLTGNLYEHDFRQHYKHVADHSLPADSVTLIYEHGSREQPAKQRFDAHPDPQLGKFEYFEAKPNDPDALHDLLREEKRSRDKLKTGNLETHITALHDSRIELEARRIVEQMKALKNPNSPNKTHFMVEISPTFAALASTKDTDRLFSMLPYKTLSFSKVGNWHGAHALISKDENRDKNIRKTRPSVRAQLAADKSKTAPKKAAAKSKHHDMEV